LAQVRTLRGDNATGTYGAALPLPSAGKRAADLDHDRRAPDTRDAVPLSIAADVAAQEYPPAAVTLLLIVETVAIFCIGSVAAALFNVSQAAGPLGAHRFAVAAAALLFPIAASVNGSFTARAHSVASLWGLRLIAPLAIAQWFAVAGFSMLHPVMNGGPAEPAVLHWLGAWFVASYVATGALNSGFEALMRHRDRAGKSVRRVVVYGGSAHGQRFIAALTRQPNPYLSVEAYFDERAGGVPDRIGEIPFGGGADELIAYVQRNGIDEIFIALPWSADGRILDILRMFRPLPASVRLAPESALLHPALGGDEATLAPVIRRTPMSPWGLFFKSVLDRAVAAAALVWFAPLFAAIAVAIKLSSPGPVFFRQNRLGFNNLPFSVYKFRTMRVASSAEQTLKQARRKDSRVTKVGAFLRRSSLDELPQLINVLKGDMSLVGPRPHPMWRKASDLWEQGGSEPIEAIVHEYAARHRVKPGITGWAQISGYRGETATIDRMLKRVELDIHYIDNWSLWFDVTIILRTFVALFKSEDVY